MSWTVSGLYVATYRDVFDLTQLALDLDADTHKIALYNNTETPNYTGAGETAYAVTNEVTGTNWSAGGVVLAGASLTEDPTGSIKFDATDISVASCTFSNAYGGKIYDANAAGDWLICGIWFGGSAYSPNNGTFQITWATAGIFAIDLTP